MHLDGTQHGNTPSSSAGSDSPAPDWSAGFPCRCAVSAAMLVASLAWLYWETICRLPRLWSLDPDYSHGYLVPGVALFFAWRRAAVCGLPIRPRVDLGDSLAGLSRVAIGGLVHAGCQLIPSFLFFDVVSLLVAGSGVLIVLGGRRGYRNFAFPLWFLIFMAPLPSVGYRWLALWLQQLTSVVAAAGLDLSGSPTVQEGYQIYLPGHVLEVGAACSGLRGILGILAASLAISELGQRQRWYRWSLLLLAIPVSIAANSVRVFITGVLVYTGHAAWSQGLWHDLDGLFTTCLAMLLLLACAWLLTQVFPAPAIRTDPASSITSPVPRTDQHPETEVSTQVRGSHAVGGTPSDSLGNRERNRPSGGG